MCMCVCARARARVRVCHLLKSFILSLGMTCLSLGMTYFVPRDDLFLSLGMAYFVPQAHTENTDSQH